MTDTDVKLCRDSFCGVRGPHLSHGDPGGFARTVRKSRGVHDPLCFDSPEYGHDNECECWCHGDEQ